MAKILSEMLAIYIKDDNYVLSNGKYFITYTMSKSILPHMIVYAIYKSKLHKYRFKHFLSSCIYAITGVILEPIVISNTLEQELAMLFGPLVSHVEIRVNKGDIYIHCYI